MPGFKELINLIETENKMDIDKIIKQYIIEFGIDNVHSDFYKNQELVEWILENKNKQQEKEKEQTYSKLDMIENEINKYYGIRQMMLKIKTEITLTIVTDIDSIDDFIEEYNNYQLYLAKYKNVDILSQYINRIQDSRNINNVEFINAKKEFKIQTKELFMTQQSPYYNIFDIDDTSKINDIQYDIRNNHKKIIKLNDIMDYKLKRVSSVYDNYMNHIGKIYEIPETDPFVQLYQLAHIPGM